MIFESYNMFYQTLKKEYFVFQNLNVLSPAKIEIDKFVNELPTIWMKVMKWRRMYNFISYVFKKLLKYLLDIQ